MRVRLLLLISLGLVLGCAGPQQQLTTCEQEKAQLLATIRAQRDEVASLRTKTNSLENRLAQSEKALARGESGRESSGSAEVADQPLQWRPQRR